MEPDEPPPDDWPCPMKAITPEALARVDAETEIARRSVAMVDGMKAGRPQK